MSPTVTVLAPASSLTALPALSVPRLPAAAGRRGPAPAPVAAAPVAPPAPGPAGGRSAAAFAVAAYVRARDAWPCPPVPVRDGCDLRV